jgi:hypothetical protein
MVTAGFEEQHDAFNDLELSALVLSFFGNSTALWRTASSMGCVPFVSREEAANAAQKRVHLLPDPQMIPGSAMMSLYPITFHVGPIEWSSEVTKAYTLFLLTLAGVFLGVQIPEFGE